jgi:quercetin dioxygenase-like cupin family protein
MFDQTDPRARLACGATTTATRAPGGSDGIAAPEYHEFATAEPREHDGARTWTARGQNFVVTYSEVEQGARLDRADHPSEYCVVLAEPRTTVEVYAGDSRVVLDQPGLVVVPPGDSAVVARTDGTVVRVFDTDAHDLAGDAINASSYEQPHPRVAPPPPARVPHAGHGLRVHRLADHPPEAGRFGAIFRTSRLMVNFLDPQQGPRDAEKLSPHHHDDFEQGSLTLRGSWVHHIRTPWTTRRSAWRDDEHRRVDGASLTIIPPPTVHTSEAVGEGANLMLDLFAPPRGDFIAQGWVLNDDDYPAP